MCLDKYVIEFSMAKKKKSKERRKKKEEEAKWYKGIREEGEP